VSRGRVDFSGSPVHGLEWLPDGDHYLQAKGGKLWKVAADSGRPEPFFDAKKLAQVLAKLPGVDAKKADEISGKTDFRMNAQKTGFLFDHDGGLYYASFDATVAQRLTKGAAELTTFSPDGKWIAFVRDNNLHAVNVATPKERKLTSDG